MDNYISNLKLMLNELANGPDTQIDSIACDKLRQIAAKETPTSEDIAELLKQCVYGALVSSFVLEVLNTLHQSLKDYENEQHSKH